MTLAQRVTCVWADHFSAEAMIGMGRKPGSVNLIRAIANLYWAFSLSPLWRKMT
jgi:hypothetical protein